MSDSQRTYQCPPAIAFLALVFMAVPNTARAADLSTYRGFTFGADLETTAALAGLRPADAEVLHRRPAVIQELEWQLRSSQTAPSSKPDPVRGGLLCFFNGHLYRMVVVYDRYRIEGMTSDDLVEAISKTYGPAEKSSSEIAFHSNYAEVAKVIARWQNAEFSYDLVRTGDKSSFALVLYSKTQDLLAQAAILEAARLDALEAPRKAQEAENQRLADERAALEKARVTNKPNFRP